MFISPYQHRYLRCLQIDNRQIAAQQRRIDLVMSDITPLSRRMPIVIPANFSGALPQALVTPSDTHDPFNGHTPSLWQEYPFFLAAHSLMVDSDGESTMGDALWADPNAPHLSQATSSGGYRLFGDNGRPSEHLQRVMQRLRQLQQEVARTQALVALLEQAGGLERKIITHHGQSMSIYRVVTDGLADRLEELDAQRAGHALIMAEAIAESQKGVAFTAPQGEGYEQNLSPFGNFI